MLTERHKEEFRSRGYTVVTGMFSQDEVLRLREHYMHLRKHGSYPGDLVGVDNKSNDPLKLYPRMIHMHRWDDLSLRWLLDLRIAGCLTGLAGREPYAAQTMLYFKPPGARGQALHQDNFYLKVQPGTCIAAWIAVDDADRENGGMVVVPGSGDLDIACPEPADKTQFFTDHHVPLP